VEEDGFRALATQLGAQPPDGLRRLDEHRLIELAEAIGDARERQAAELEAAGERALRHIPKLLRIPIRKVLG
jgi:hypothetical protein